MTKIDLCLFHYLTQQKRLMSYGTTKGVAHKCSRKWIGVEMGEHFWTVVLPRMKKVLAYDKSGISKELKTPRQTSSDTPLPHPYPSQEGKEGNERKYLFILGEKEGRDIAVVWRDYEDSWSESDFKKDKEFIIRELEPWTPHIVYVNGQSVLTPNLGSQTVEIRYIEPEYKRLMER